MTSFNLSLRNLINMTNGVVGLSILTMPFCFEQCGLILGTISLIICALLTSYSCDLLISCANIKKTKNFEYLAFKVFGHKGKLLIEICIILLLCGSLITSCQIANEVGPDFIIKTFDIKNFKIPDWFFSIIFTLFVILPVNLSKKLDKLNKISAFALFFYFIFGFYMIWLASDKINSEPLWKDRIKYWDFSGLLKCFPIFSISFSCQTVLFYVYDELCEISRQNIKKLADSAIITAFCAYFFAGFFGYIAFFDVEILGNAIGNLPDTFMNQVIKFGFIVCVLSGFPFMVFPCRTSIYTLLFADKDEVFETDLTIPELKFKYITYFLVIITAFISILIPNIEFVLSLTGATTGSLICYVWPSILYIYSRAKQDNFKDTIVNIFFVTGIMIFFVCTSTTFVKFKPTQQSDQIIISNNLNNLALGDNSIRFMKNFPKQILLDKVDGEKRLEPPVPEYNDYNNLEIQDSKLKILSKTKTSSVHLNSSISNTLDTIFT